MSVRESPFQHPEVECLDRDGIIALQNEKLKGMARRLAARPEWRDHLAKAGIKPKDLADRQALASVPMLEKADLRALYPFPMLGVAMDAVVRFFATSGTTGPPVMFGFTEADMRRLGQQTARMLRSVGFRPGDKVYQGHGYGLWIGGPAMDAGLATLGATNFPLGPGRAELAIGWLRDQGYTGCIMAATWLIHLAKVAHDHGIDPKTDWRLRLGTFGGQPVSAGLLDEIEAAMPEGFHARVCYGTTEAGGPVLGASCPHSHDDDEMHLINDDAILTEIVDPETLKPVDPGEVGEVVVTTLDKEASPVVRWRTRDLVRLSDKPFDCPCGRKGLPRIGLIIGRSDDMLKVRGVIVFPSQIEDVVATVAGTVKHAWQVIIDREDRVLEDMTVEIERADDASRSRNEIARTVGRELAARLGIRVNVVCHEEGVLPRYEGKANRVTVRY